MTDNEGFEPREGGIVGPRRTPQSTTLAKQSSIKLALEDHPPVDAFGGPVGKTTGEVVKAIRRPLGISAAEWMTALEVATEWFRMTSGLSQPDKQKLMSISDMPKRTWDLIYRKENQDTFEAALALKGILKKGSGLTFEQLRALRYLTDVTVKGDITRKLKTLGISWEVFQNWSKDEKFQAQYKARSEDILKEAEPMVMVELAKGAVEGKLDAIKYFHQVTGQFSSQEQSDMKAFLSGLIEILTGELKDDRAMLIRISERLQLLKERTLGGN